MSDEIKRLRSELVTFIGWACFGGITIPLLCNFGCELYFDNPVKNFSFGKGYCLLFTVTIIVALGGPIITLFRCLPMTDAATDNGGDPASAARKWLYCSGLFTAVCMGLIVIYTGGPLTSPFAFYLLYLPSVTAVAFTPSDNTRIRGQGLIFVSLVCLFLIFIGLIYPQSPQDFDNFLGTKHHKTLYLFTVFIQLCSIVFLERKDTSAA